MKTIMIVDDHAGLRKTVGAWLREVFPHCRVMEAATGEDAITYARTAPLNVIIMDVELPGVNGIEAARAVRSIQPETAIVMLSLHEEDDYLDASRMAGAYAFVPKRTMREDLVPVLRRLLSDVRGADLARATE